jgi:transcriptional regulator with XRE-family HTH domain
METHSKAMEAAIAKQIRVELTERDMTQADLADAIGTGRDVLNRYLKGHTSMTTRTFYKIAEALKVAPSVLPGRAQERLPASAAEPGLSAKPERP